ncbi:MAG TPA: hypothetical protein VHU41_20495 [Thermoanaerobaculia bacterium]|nr:hypothetical protein [Thermoanaerobaculia bacterium]
MSRRFAIPALLMVVILATGFIAGRATAAQPHMVTALDHLRAARTSLEKADADKGGHRAAAIDLTDRAIHEVEEGIGYARHH